MANIVVANVASLINYKTDLEGLLRGILWKEIEANANLTFQDEVHLRHLIFFIVDDALALLCEKLSRLQVEGNIIQEFRVCIFACLEEVFELVENIIIEELDHDVFLDHSWESL